jgi:hypothetical protein
MVGKKCIIWTEKIKLRNKCHFVESKTQDLQHILKMQKIFFLLKYTWNEFLGFFSFLFFSLVFTSVNAGHLRVNRTTLCLYLVSTLEFIAYFTLWHSHLRAPERRYDTSAAFCCYLFFCKILTKYPGYLFVFVCVYIYVCVCVCVCKRQLCQSVDGIVQCPYLLNLPLKVGKW